MDRKKLHELFWRHRGSLSRVALAADVELATVSNWFSRGDTSATIERVVFDRAETLLAEEEQRKQTFVRAHPALLQFAGLS